MSYNQNAFNRAPFNLSQSGNTHYLVAEGFEYVDSFAGVSTQVYLFCIANERVGINIHGERFVDFEIKQIIDGREYREGYEQIGYNVALEGTYWLDVESREIIDPNVMLSSEMRIKASAVETISENAYLACHISIPASGSEIMSPDIVWHIDYHTSASGNELVSQTTDAEVIEEITCELELTLMPGQRLIVDASNYNVLVDGDNMIYTQKGEWLDELSRETRSITITAAEGEAGISAMILYTERFL